jgi:hypothetical protein
MSKPMYVYPWRYIVDSVGSRYERKVFGKQRNIELTLEHSNTYYDSWHTDCFSLGSFSSPGTGMNTIDKYGKVVGNWVFILEDEVEKFERLEVLV